MCFCVSVSLRRVRTLAFDVCTVPKKSHPSG